MRERWMIYVSRPPHLARRRIPSTSSVTQSYAGGLVDPGLEPVGKPTVVVTVLAEVGAEGVNVRAGPRGGKGTPEVLGRGGRHGGEDRAEYEGTRGQLHGV